MEMVAITITPTESLINYLLSNKYSYGDFISLAELNRATGIPPLTNEIKDKLNAEQIKSFLDDYSFKRLQAISGAKDYFLIEHKMLLSNKKAEGYVFVPPSDQLDHCIEKGAKKIDRALSETISGVENVNYSMLGADERARGVDCAVKLGSLRNMISRNARKLQRSVSRVLK